jgi:hypothetical protein
MSLRWQYQSISKPVFVPVPPEVNVGWLRALSEPVRAAPVVTALLGTFLSVDPTALIAAEDPTLPKWQRQLSEPVRTIPPVEPGLVVRGPDPSEIPPPAGVFLEWWRPLDEPTRLPPALVQEGTSVVDADQLTQPEDPTLPKWHRPLTEPVWTTPPVEPGIVVRAPDESEFDEGPPDLPLGPFPTVETQGDLATSHAPNIETIRNTLPTDLPNIDWLRQPVIPQGPTAPASAPNYLKPPEVPVPSFDWFLDPVSPPTSLPAIPPFYTTDRLKPALLEYDWHHPTEEPVFEAPRLVQEGTSVVDADQLTQPEDPTLPKWHRPLSEPLFDVAPVEPGLFVRGPDPSEIPTPTGVFLEWWRPISEPIRALPALVQEGAVLVDADLLTQPEDPTLSKWWQPASEPVRLPDPAASLFGFSFHPAPIVAAPLPEFGWFHPTEEPVFRGPTVDPGFLGFSIRGQDESEFAIGIERARSVSIHRTIDHNAADTVEVVVQVMEGGGTLRLVVGGSAIRIRGPEPPA